MHHYLSTQTKMFLVAVWTVWSEYQFVLNELEGFSTVSCLQLQLTKFQNLCDSWLTPFLTQQNVMQIVFY